MICALGEFTPTLARDVREFRQMLTRDVRESTSTLTRDIRKLTSTLTRDVRKSTPALTGDVKESTPMLTKDVIAMESEFRLVLTDFIPTLMTDDGTTGNEFAEFTGRDPEAPTVSLQDPSAVTLPSFAVPQDDQSIGAKIRPVTEENSVEPAVALQFTASVTPQFTRPVTRAVTSVVTPTTVPETVYQAVVPFSTLLLISKSPLPFTSGPKYINRQLFSDSEEGQIPSPISSQQLADSVPCLPQSSSPLCSHFSSVSSPEPEPEPFQFLPGLPSSEASPVSSQEASSAGKVTRRDGVPYPLGGEILLWFAVASDDERIQNKRVLEDIEGALISSEAGSTRETLERVRSILLTPRCRLPHPLRMSLELFLI
jgi:hypothetical protein